MTKGWFKAPADGQYRFLISCSDSCTLSLDSNNFYEKGIEKNSNPFEIAVRNIASEWRHYFMPINSSSSEKWKSDWILLRKDDFYPIEGYQMHNSDNEGHFTVSVEFEQDNTEDH